MSRMPLTATEGRMSRYTLALGVILMVGVPVCAQQSHSSTPQKPQTTSSGPIPDRNINGHAGEIPAWNIHGHAEEIPVSDIHSHLEEIPTPRSIVSVTVTQSTVVNVPPPCVIVAKHGKKYDFVEGFGPPTARFKKHLSERGLKKFTSRGGLVETLLSHYTKSDIQSARSACTQGPFPGPR